MVAVDVRVRAREADVDLPWRVRGRGARRLRRQLAVRRRVAHHERRGRARAPAARHCDRAPRPLVRAHEARRAARLHARGARLERRCDRPLRAARLRSARYPPRLLHGQPGRRVDHVARRATRRVLLGIETSCDETAAAVVSWNGDIVSNVVASQAELHARFGGVVPEVASRRHLELIAPVVEEALNGYDVDAIAVTARPGLIGALLVGVSAAKALAWARRLPLIPVHHPHGPAAPPHPKPLALQPPFTCLLASGGHTMLLDVRERGGYTVLGTTLDDAAGEAFDKGARPLGLGSPGGGEIDRLAAQGDPAAYDFPVARVPGLDFSFSGLKTALLYKVRGLPPRELEARRADLAAGYQRAIVRALVERLEAAGGERIAVVGGGPAN